MTYRHTQRAPGWLLLAVIGLAGLIGAWLLRDQGLVALAVGVFGVVFILLALCFKTLTVVDEGDVLAIRFGPIPTFFKRISYASITHAQASTSSIIDGWGIHYVFGRGWTYNLWGRSCVQVTIDGGTVRIGTDDAENLARFLQSKLST